MRKNFIYVLFIMACLTFVGCSTISYNKAKRGLKNPNRYRFIISNPAWSTEGQAVYFIVLGVPCKYEVVSEDGFTTLQRFPFLYTGYYGVCTPDLTRKVIYKFIQLIPINQGTFTVLMDWQLLEYHIPFDLNSLNVLDKDRFILRQILYSMGTKKPFRIRETIIDTKKLQIDIMQKAVEQDWETACKSFVKRKIYPIGWEAACEPFLKTNIVYSPDGNKFIKILDDFIVVFDISGKNIAQFSNTEIGALPQAAIFSPDGSKLALSDSKNNIYIFDIEKNELFTYSLDTLIETFGYRQQD